MKVLMVGSYDIDLHSRAKVIREGLKANGVDVILGITKNPVVMLFKILRSNYDVLFVTGKIWLFMAWALKLFHRKPILFDVFISDYDSLVFDRKTVKKNSLKARLLWICDKWSCALADHVIHDTKLHIDYFAEEFKSKKEKCSELPIGADETIFYPRGNKVKKYDKFTVMFHGTFIPLQGIQYVLRAAQILKNEDIQFKLIGNGQTYNEMVSFAKSIKLDEKKVEFMGMKPMKDLPALLCKGHVVLGIFGTTEKAQRVIPNKAFEAIALEMPLISGDTPIMRANFTNNENCMLSQIGDEMHLSRCILKLRDDIEFRNKIAKGGYDLYKSRFTMKDIGAKVKTVIEEKLHVR